MVRTIDLLVGLTSTVTRLSAYTFLRWIPGHHFPPIIIASLVLYLTLIVTSQTAFGSGRPSLREAFPKLFRHEKRQKSDEQKHLDVYHEEPFLYEEETKLLKIFGLGIPNWHEWEFSYLSIGLNILVVLLSLDLVFRGPTFHDGKTLRFSRVGYVDDTSANVLIREPDAAALPLYAYLRPATDLSWSTTDTIYRLGEDTDFTRGVQFMGLKADTTYTYSFSNELKGNFKTAPAKGSAQAKSLTFLTSSCIKANFPYNPFSHSLAIHGFKYIGQVMRSLPSPAAFMLFVGDFIYVDVPFRLSSSQEHYRSEYRRVYASPSWQTRGLDLPWLHTLDDHEIANDWAGGNETEPFPAASDPFINYHVAVNPPVPLNVPSGVSHNATFFQFTQGPASFFMMDTRRYRTRPETHLGTSKAKPLYGSSSRASQEPEEAPTMLGAMQLQALLTFLQKPETTDVHWKIVASSVPFTKNWRFGTSDTWGGFLHERAQILEAMHFAEAHLGVRVVILSGDRHEFAAIRFPPKDIYSAKTSSLGYDDAPGRGPHEFSVGPLSMFYQPFRTFKQIDDEDVALAYYPDGNSKIGSVEIVADAASSSTKSTFKYTLWIDGKAVWEYSIASPNSAKSRRSHLDTWFA